MPSTRRRNSWSSPGCSNSSKRWFSSADSWLAEQRAQGLVDLQDAAVGAHDGHADGRVREGRGEALLVQLGLALGLGDARLLRLVVGLVAAQRIVHQRQHGAGHRGRHHDDGGAELARVHRQHAGHRGRQQIDGGQPAVVLRPVGERDALAVLGRHDRQQRQRGAREIGQRHQAQRDQRGGGRRTGRRSRARRAGPRRAAAQQHRGGGCRRRADAAGQPLGRAPGADQALGTGRQCRRRRTVQCQQREDEDVGDADRVLGARDVQRKQRHHGDEGHAQRHAQQRRTSAARPAAAEPSSAASRPGGHQRQPARRGGGVVVEQVPLR